MQNDSLWLPSGQDPSASDKLCSDGRGLDNIPENSRRTAAPGILLTATLRWPIAARLAIAFANMGCRVEAVCPRQHPVTRTRAIRRIYPYAVKYLASSALAGKKSVRPLDRCRIPVEWHASGANRALRATACMRFGARGEGFQRAQPLTQRGAWSEADSLQDRAPAVRPVVPP